MALIIRHGGEAHTMRPDRVYRTGVLQSMFGWNPSRDVNSVASSFTNGPPSGMGLNGLRGLGAAGPLTRFGLRVKAWLSERKAQRFMQIGAPSNSAVYEGNTIAPQIAAQMQMLAHLAPRSGGGPQAAAYTAAMRRYNTFFRAG